MSSSLVIRYIWRSQQAPDPGKLRQARLTGRWHGPAVVIGREWDKDKEASAYWVQHCHTLLFNPWTSFEDSHNV